MLDISITGFFTLLRNFRLMHLSVGFTKNHPANEIAASLQIGFFCWVLILSASIPPPPPPPFFLLLSFSFRSLIYTAPFFIYISVVSPFLRRTSETGLGSSKPDWPNRELSRSVQASFFLNMRRISYQIAKIAMSATRRTVV